MPPAVRRVAPSTISHSLPCPSQLTPHRDWLTGALFVTLTGNHLEHDQQTLGLHQLQSAQYIVAPLLVPPIAALAGHLEAAVTAVKPCQEIAFGYACGW